ncbi:lipocalin-like domain-containing protein [Vibrio sp.]|uniref:lipocalin-like domain-containing protein n=1 Tax=Vibrio sp. TaxID=678 RepID=UPI003D0B3858
MNRRYRNLQSLLIAIVLLIAISAAILWLWSPNLTKQETVDDLSGVLPNKQSVVFAPVSPGKPVVIPDAFQIQPEYQYGLWNFNANVNGADGKPYTIQWSFWRIGQQNVDLPGWRSPQLYLSYLVVSSPVEAFKEQRLARGGIGQAGMNSKPFRLFIDNWQWRAMGSTPLPGNLRAATDGFSVDLKMVNTGQYSLPGEEGYLPHHDLFPIASYEIAAPFIQVSGEIQLGAKTVTVEGKGWLSKEWGSSMFEPYNFGWDWFVLNLADDSVLQLSQIRYPGHPAYVYASQMRKDGQVVNLEGSNIVLEPIQYATQYNGRRIPVVWRLRIAELNVDVTVHAQNINMWLPFAIPYWQGGVTTKGSHSVNGYMQLQGY